MDPGQSDDDSNFYKEEAVKEESNQERNRHQAKTKSIKKKQVRKHKEHTASKSRTSKEKEGEMHNLQIAQERAKVIIEEMVQCYKKDLELAAENKMAVRKVVYLTKLIEELRNVYTSSKFLEMNGLQKFQLWLGSEGKPEYKPSFAVRKGLFEILLFLRVKSEHIVRVQELQRIIQKYKKSSSKQLRDASEQIISLWSKITQEDNE